MKSTVEDGQVGLARDKGEQNNRGRKAKSRWVEGKETISVTLLWSPGCQMPALKHCYEKARTEKKKIGSIFLEGGLF